MALSLPLRKCGLKRETADRTKKMNVVTSLAEVWIETLDSALATLSKPVTSLAEVWIETGIDKYYCQSAESLPLRKCGLKLHGLLMLNILFRHFPCGSVD